MAGEHILIVDDYPDALDIWTIYLQSMGYRVSTASDGEEAVAQAERLLPDLIVLDLELPRISGICQFFSTKPRQVHITKSIQPVIDGYHYHIATFAKPDAIIKGAGT